MGSYDQVGVRVGEALTQWGLNQLNAKAEDDRWAKRHKQLAALERAEEEEAFQRRLRREAKYGKPEERERDELDARSGRTVRIREEGRADPEAGWQWREVGRSEVEPKTEDVFTATVGNERVTMERLDTGRVRPLMVGGQEARGPRYKVDAPRRLSSRPSGMPADAKQAPDGKWYVKRNGVWNRVD